MYQGIRLKADHIDDVEVMSSLLQDAVFRVDDMTYQKNNHRFALVANRFRWEAEVLRRKKPKGKESYQRVRAGLRFEGVLGAQFKNVPFRQKSKVMSLLSLDVKKKKKDFVISLTFSGNAVIRLTTEVVEVYLEDITGPWDTRSKPQHPVT